MAAIIEIENLSKHYELGTASRGTLREVLSSFHHKNREVFKALDNVSFNVERGESIGIIGSNGAGKSTLLKVLSKITKPTSGRAIIDGRVTSLLEVGTGFHPELTGRENIFLNGSILGMNKTEIKSKFDAIVSFSGVEKFLDTPVKHYSSGMYVRLAFAIAAHLEPEILIVDEVLAVGDIEFQEKCIGKMNEVSALGRTVIFVSHNLRSVQALCSRGIVLEKGCITYDGNIKDSIQFYQARVGRDRELNSSFGVDRNIGNGKFRFRKVWIEDTKRNSATQVKSADTIYIRTSISAESKVSANVVCRIYDDMDVRIASLTSTFFKEKHEIEDGSIITWEIIKLPLTGGNYRLELAAYEDFNGNTLIDEVSHALKFSIADHDYYGFGVPQGEGRNKMYLDFKISTSNEKRAS